MVDDDGPMEGDDRGPQGWGCPSKRGAGVCAQHDHDRRLCPSRDAFGASKADGAGPCFLPFRLLARHRQSGRNIPKKSRPATRPDPRRFRCTQNGTGTAWGSHVSVERVREGLVTAASAQTDRRRALRSKRVLQLFWCCSGAPSEAPALTPAAAAHPSGIAPVAVP